MRQIDVYEAKLQLSRLLEDVEAGEQIIIARAGHPVAILSRFEPAARRLGLFACQARIADDFDELPAEIAEAFAGGSA